MDKSPTSLIAVCLTTLAMIPAFAAEPGQPGKSAAELRKSAKDFLGALPDKMPGAEKDTSEQIELGRKLFFEKKLSVNQTQSCNSCHAVDRNLGGVDNKPTSPGAFGKFGDRNSPTVLNAGFQTTQFWDGRAPDLETQAKGPILNPGEMAMPNEAEAVNRLRASAEYPSLFAKAFPSQKDPVSYDNVGKAIAAFERTLVTKDRFDDFVKGDDKALSPLELKGLDTFVQTGCIACHSGPALGGNMFQKAGLIHPYENKSDEGLSKITKDPEDKFKFKVPMLRNVAITGPYFHDGKIATLHAAVRKMGWIQLGKELPEEEVNALVAFLKTLTDKTRVAPQKSSGG